MGEQTPVRELVRRSLKKRRAAERRFRAMGFCAVFFSLAILSLMLLQIFISGVGAFRQSYITLDIHYDAQVLGITTVSEESLSFANFDALVRNALQREFPELTVRSEQRELNRLVSMASGYQVRDRLLKRPQLLNTKETLQLLADDEVDMYVKHAKPGRLSERQRQWVDALRQQDKIVTRFNRVFFTSGDSSEPEQAGILGALSGTLLTLFFTFVLSFPTGVAAALYLEEFAKKNAFSAFLELNINNLAAVPSIIYGLLGLAIFINWFGMPRSVPLVGGLVLFLITLPTVIISSRAAIQAVPYSIREAALGMGASRMQVAIDHVLRSALPGMLTGAIIGIARALGESAPLLMIGMMAFIVDIPENLSDPATVLPVQIYIWASASEQAFVERTAAAILVLLLLLIIINAIAVWMRHKVERRW